MLHPLRNPRVVLAVLLPLSLQACGGSESVDETAGRSATPAPTAAGSLSVTVAGTTHASRAAVKESGVKFGDRLDAVLIADSHQDPSGLPELSMTIIAGSRRTGDFKIVFNQNKIGREGGSELAIVHFEVGSEGTRLAATNGTLKIATLETRPAAGNYAIVRLAGTFEGEFRAQDEAAGQQVTGSFDYVANR